MVGGKQEAELEDLYREEVYAGIIKAECGLDWQVRGEMIIRNGRIVSETFSRRAGKPHGDADVMPIKIKVANAAALAGYACLQGNKKGPIDSLINSLSHKLKLPPEKPN